MNILHILPSLYTGGGEKVSIEICNELSKNKEHKITLCSLVALTEQQQIMYKKIAPTVKFITLNKKGKNPSIFFQVIKMIYLVKPDIIHTHLRALYFSAAGIILSGKPNIHTIHTVAHKETEKNKLIFYKILYKYFNFTPVSISERVLQSSYEVYGNNSKFNIGNGVAKLEETPLIDEVKGRIDKLRKNENTKIFISVGRLYHVKNQLLLIEAFQKLLKEGHDAHLFVIGSEFIDKEYAQKCKELVDGNKNIHLVGEKSNVADYLLQADALCFTSIYEGIPMTILEAMSIGLLTISTPVGGIPDLIEDGVNGFLSADMSKESYFEVFRKIIEGKKLDSAKIKDIYNQKYSIKLCAKQYEELYRKSIKND